MATIIGKYIGNGTGPRYINGLGMRPKAIIQWQLSYPEYQNFFSDVMETYGGGAASSGVATEQIISADVDGFYVPSSSSTFGTNGNNVSYYFVATDSVFCATGTWVGTGSAQSISVPFRPSSVFAGPRDGAQSWAWRVDGMDDDRAVSKSFYGGLVGSQIQRMSASGFDVGTTFSALNRRYFYLAFKDEVGFHKSAKYTGTGGDNTNLTFSPNVTPGAVWGCRIDSNILHYYHHDSYNTGDSSIREFLAPGSNYIQANIPNGFQVGTDANANTVPYIFTMWQAVAPPPASTPVVPRNAPTSSGLTFTSGLYERYKTYRKAASNINNIGLSD